MKELIDFFKSEYTFTLSGSAISAVGIIFSFGFLFILGMLVNLYKKMKEAQAPKYGFLGKPLYQAAVVAFVVVGFGSSLFIASNQTQLKNSFANENLEVDFNYQILNSMDGRNLVELNITPKVNNIAWDNEPTRQFDIIVNIYGNQADTVLLYDKTQLTQAKGTTVLNDGSYTVVITISSEQLNGTFTKSITL